MKLHAPNWLIVILSFVLAAGGYAQIAQVPVIGPLIDSIDPTSGAEMMFLAWLLLFAGIVMPRS